MSDDDLHSKISGLICRYAKAFGNEEDLDDPGFEDCYTWQELSDFIAQKVMELKNE